MSMTQKNTSYKPIPITPEESRAGVVPVDPELEVHDAANIFPPPTEEEFQAIEKDIAENGQREPARTYQGKLIDGRSRQQACKELGLKLKVKEWDGSGSLIEYALSLNLHRRHLSSSQRATLAVEIEPMLAREAQERERTGKSTDGTAGGRGRTKNPPQGIGEGKAGGGKHSGEAAERAARLAGTNREYVRDAKKIKDEDPELYEDIRQRKTSVPAGGYRGQEFLPLCP